MSRNAESRFAMNPTKISIQRSTFDRPSKLVTSFNVGELIPIYYDQILPGDTFQMKSSKVVRLQTLLAPIMDDLYLDTYWFFVPNRLVWEHWQEFMGENTASAWIPQTTYTVPQVRIPGGGYTIGTLADYFGIPTGVTNNTMALTFDALPFRAYTAIVNDWFRDENLQDPANLPVDDTTIGGSNGSNYITDLVKGGKPFKVCKFHDYFTSCLPAPQKGPDVALGFSQNVGVYGDGGALQLENLNEDGTWLHGSLLNSDAGTSAVYNSNKHPFIFGATDNYITSGVVGHPKSSSSADADSHPWDLANVVSKETADSANLSSSGLMADLSSASMITINQLRMAFQIQKFYERDARGGTRYIELLKSHFGVTSPDARLQRPEYLGGNRVPLHVAQVVQNSETSTTPQGNVAGYSVTADTHYDFKKSFVEHGMLIGLACVRYRHSYQQGLNRMWSRKTRFDFYWPAFANIGEQPVLNKEIYLQTGASGLTQNERVFGYQEAWADYRYKPSFVTGEMRSAATVPLDSWHLADNYNSLPVLSSSWIQEDANVVDRVIAVSSRVSNQLFGDWYFDCKATRAMPMYSIPGLIDHN